MDHVLFQSIDRLIKPLKSRMASFILRGIIHRSSESGRVLQVSLGSGDTQDNIKKWEHFGFTSIPPLNSDALILFPSGSRTAGFCIASQSQTPCPVELKEGESAQYNQEQSFIALRLGGKVQIKAGPNELISMLYELVEKVSKLEKVQSVKTPVNGAPIDGVLSMTPAIDVGNLLAKLDAMRAKS